MKDKFEIELSMRAKIVLEHEKGSNQIKVVSKDVHDDVVDYIYLNHNSKLRMIKWLINSCENID